MDRDISRPSHCDPEFDKRACLFPFTLEKVGSARSEVGPTDRKRMLRLLGNLNCLRLIFCRVGESSELGKAHWKPRAIQDRSWDGHPESIVQPFSGQRCDIA